LRKPPLARAARSALHKPALIILTPDLPRIESGWEGSFSRRVKRKPSGRLLPARPAVPSGAREAPYNTNMPDQRETARYLDCRSAER